MQCLSTHHTLHKLLVQKVPRNINGYAHGNRNKLNKLKMQMLFLVPQHSASSIFGTEFVLHPPIYVYTPNIICLWSTTACPRHVLALISTPGVYTHTLRAHGSPQHKWHREVWRKPLLQSSSGTRAHWPHCSTCEKYDAIIHTLGRGETHSDSPLSQ